MALRSSSVTGAGGKAAASAGSAGFAELSARCSRRGAAVCLHGPVVKARLASVQQQELLSSSLSSAYQSTHLANQSHRSPTSQRKGSYIRQPFPGPNSPALIDIEESGDGSVTFKYGEVQDLWDLDRLLEYLCDGAFRSHTAQSFVSLVIELFRVPVSVLGRRRLVELLSSYTRLGGDVSSAEMEKMASQALAEAASEYLPPTSVGTYIKGRARPFRRFCTRMDKWWKNLDNYLGVGDGSVDFLPEHSFNEIRGCGMQPSLKHDTLGSRSSYERFKPDFSNTLDMKTPEFCWLDSPAPVSWLARPPQGLSLRSQKSSALDIVPEKNSSSGPSQGNYVASPKISIMEAARDKDSSSGISDGESTAGLNFVLLSSLVNTLEDVLKKTELEDSSLAPKAVLAPVSDVETLPASSIQAMVQWEDKETFVPSSASLPSRPGNEKKTMPRSKPKTTQRVRGKASSTKSASKKKTTPERPDEYQLFDIFFALPVYHKCSGVARFLVMRKNLSEEVLATLNSVAVGLAGAGLAVTLQVCARMLSVNSTFDISKLIGVIRGAGLLWLSEAVRNLRKAMVGLPPGCTVSSVKDKEQLLCLQRRLRSFSFRVMTVMVVAVVSHGF